MNRIFEGEPIPTARIEPDPIKGHVRFHLNLKSESGDASMLISAGVGSLILLSVMLYPIISDRIFERRVENYCMPSTIIGPAQCYHNITPEGEK